MTADENRALLMRYIEEVWNAGRPDAAEHFLARDYRRHLSPTMESLDREGQINRLRGFRQAFPDISIAVETVIADQQYVAFRSTMSGTHHGPFLGVAPTGRAITVSLLDLIRIEANTFVEHWGGPDLHDLLKQLGAH
jgi:steroid delta-isomerase-like uncharacterized protein